MPGGAGDVPEAKQVTLAFKWLKGVKSHGHVASMYAGSHPWGRMFQEYQDILRSCNAIEYDDMLSMVSAPSLLHLPCLMLLHKPAVQHTASSPSCASENHLLSQVQCAAQGPAAVHCNPLPSCYPP